MIISDKLILHYKIIDKLGEGGMGVVYKAEDTKLKRNVAIKFLPHYYSILDEEKRRFEIEAQATASLNHPNITIIHSIEEVGEEKFIVMEYIDGVELKEKIKNNPLPPDEILNLSIQICEALNAAHNKGIIHRDIKSQNIMITRDGRVKMMDFGLAKIGKGTQVTKAGSIFGTLAYMSPEQLKGEEADQRSDIWSLGVVLYEMVTGKLPFNTDYEQAMIYAILNEEPKPVSESRSDINLTLQNIIEKALQKNAAARHQSTKEILAELLNQKIAAGSSPGTVSSQDAKKINTKLPVQLTSFIGRENEIDALKKLIPVSRLITLTGSGGTGKTRLALQIVEDISEQFEHGTFFIPLASISDPVLLAPTIAKILGVHEIGGQSIIESLEQYVQDKHMLLLLDNFEQILPAATFIHELLIACENIKMLVTSRSALHITGEQEFPVNPLSLPNLKQYQSLESLAQSDAIKLFVQRAHAVKPQFNIDHSNASAIAEICFQLDGLPLAIELAAVRIKLLTPQDILPKLKNRLKLLVGGPRDVPSRQQTLRGAIEWSYNLLNEDEKKLLCRLSLFTGGFTLDAAESVCNINNDLELEILEGVSSLLDKSLLRESEPSRYYLLETIREFGLECMANTGEVNIYRKAHRDFFLSFSEMAEPYLAGPDQKKWLEKLDLEHDNIRAAFDWSLLVNDIEPVLRMGTALWRYWLIYGYFNEGREKLSALLLKSDPSEYPDKRVKVITGAGVLAHNQGDLLEARSLFEASLDLNRKLTDKRGIAASLNNLGWIAWRLGDYTEAYRFSEEGLRLYKVLEDNSGIATSKNNLGWIAHHQGNFSTAISFHKDCMVLWQKSGNRRSIAFAKSNLGWAMQKQGDYDRALPEIQEALSVFKEIGEKQLFAFALNILAEWDLANCNYEKAINTLEESITVFRQIGDKYGLAYALSILGDSFFYRDNYKQAVEFYEESLSLRKVIQDKWGIAQVLHRKTLIEIILENFEMASELCRESLSLRVELEDKLGIAECFEGLAELAIKQNRLEHASQLLSSANILRKRICSPITKPHLPRHEKLINTLQNYYKEEIDKAFNLNDDITLENMIKIALSE